MSKIVYTIEVNTSEAYSEARIEELGCWIAEEVQTFDPDASGDVIASELKSS